jgi:16S rRNA (guanine527-N7)-methyltransferase
VSEGEVQLRSTLEEARRRGFLGPGPVEVHLAHALGFVEVISALGAPTSPLLDLGTGGGVPGLVLAARFPAAAVVLLEASQRRSEFLRGAVEEHGWSDRVEVVRARGEEAARRPALRERYSLVTARSFAEPAVTAEIAAGFLAVGGYLVVSEPPEASPGRWPTDALEELGYAAARPYELDTRHFVAIAKTVPTPDDVPRAVGRPAKRPRW